MDEMGKAMMGTGEARGEDRAVQAAEKAIANPLLDEISLHGAKGVLINITGGYDLTLFELDEAANIIREKVDPDANIIVGSTLDTSMEGAIRVSVVATGIDASASNRAETPVARRSMASVSAPAYTTPVAAAEPKPEPRRDVPVQEPVMDDEPSLFESVRKDVAEDEFFEEADSDELPPPAYRPQAAQAAAPAARAPAAMTEDDPSVFVAPRARQIGQPSPEALARLQAAASKLPLRTPGAAAPAARPAAPAPRTAEKPRFGIGSLINRMSGHSEPVADRGAAAQRQQPPVTGYDEETELSADEERIEIPAFLRRQAN
jgi:cell division protein FtsZ